MSRMDTRDGIAEAEHETGDRLRRTEMRLLDAERSYRLTRDERDAAIARASQLEDLRQREVFGLNNEGDPIGGDPPAGWKPRAVKADAALSECRVALQAMVDTFQPALKEAEAVGDGCMPGWVGAIRQEKFGPAGNEEIDAIRGRSCPRRDAQPLPCS